MCRRLHAGWSTTEIIEISRMTIGRLFIAISHRRMNKKKDITIAVSPLYPYPDCYPCLHHTGSCHLRWLIMAMDLKIASLSLSGIRSRNSWILLPCRNFHIKIPRSPRQSSHHPIMWDDTRLTLDAEYSVCTRSIIVQRRPA